MEPTDEQKLIDVLHAFGIPFRNIKTPQVCNSNFIVIDAKSSPKVNGYSGFQVEFHFDDDGKFMTMGIWE